MTTSRCICTEGYRDIIGRVAVVTVFNSILVVRKAQKISKCWAPINCRIKNFHIFETWMGDKTEVGEIKPNWVISSVQD